MVKLVGDCSELIARMNGFSQTSSPFDKKQIEAAKINTAVTIENHSYGTLTKHDENTSKFSLNNNDFDNICAKPNFQKNPAI